MLRCEDCGREASDDTRGWIAVVLEKDADNPVREVLTYCPDCSKQFDDDSPPNLVKPP